MKLGIEVLLTRRKWIKRLRDKRLGLVCHPASVDADLSHSLDLLASRLTVTCAFGPQHGVRGDKQDNMIESPNFVDPVHKIPVFSLYGAVRRPTPEMMEHFDVLLFDLQDLGCRIYTFATTLLYVMEECARFRKPLFVLDRPNPAGRTVEGFRLTPGWESFVGAAPLPMRHGLTVGELALYYQDYYKLDLELHVIRMKGYRPNRRPGFGWPMDRAWVNPSPNAASLNMARAYPGTVLIEGTTLSEGRGTTRALELVGAPDLNYKQILERMRQIAPQWLEGAVLRECYFEPTTHKHAGRLCHGFHCHTDHPSSRPSEFKAFRTIALMLKAIRELKPDYPIYREFTYEYVADKLPFDVINGGPALRIWIEDPQATVSDLDQALAKDERAWIKERKRYLLY